MTASKTSRAAEQIVAEAKEQHRTALLEPEAKMICRVYGLPLPEFQVATSKSQAVASAKKLTYPVALKIVSPDILHKTEAGGVLLNINSKVEVEEGYKRLILNAKKFKKNARIAGVLVQHMAPAGLEVIAGGLRDPQFGVVVMFGLGGIFAEMLEDVAFGISPVSMSDAREMMQNVRGRGVLRGFRGQPPVDGSAIARIICRVSSIMDENIWIEQLDLNPVIAYEHGCSIVDARILLGEKQVNPCTKA